MPLAFLPYIIGAVGGGYVAWKFTPDDAGFIRATMGSPASLLGLAAVIAASTYAAKELRR